MFMPNLGSFLPPRIRIREKIPVPDPDPWPENIPDPHGSGSETLLVSIFIYPINRFTEALVKGLSEKNTWTV